MSVANCPRAVSMAERKRKPYGCALGWISEYGAEEREHRFEHCWVNWCSRIEVEVNRVPHHVISGAVGTSALLRSVCLPGSVSRMVTRTRRPDITVRAPTAAIAQLRAEQVRYNTCKQRAKRISTVSPKAIDANRRRTPRRVSNVSDRGKKF